MNAALPIQQIEPAILAAGAVVGRYRLEQRIGAGGVGQIWRARHLELGHAVAIKLLESSGDGPVERKRFFQEARLSAQLGRTCRHIVRVEDHGVVEMADGVRPYLVMELLDGETLGSRLRREPNLTLREIATVVQHVARALTVTHAAGVVHRDLKPSNIFLTADPEAGVCTKLLDFGIARDTSADGLTRTGSIIGTPGYMSPEQISGRDLDTRADLWSLSAVIFRMLTLKPPFGTGTFEELTARVLWQVAPAPSSLRPELPAALDRFMAQGLAHSAADRFQTAEELSLTFSAIVEAVELGQETSLPLPALVSEAITEIAPSQPQASDGQTGLAAASGALEGGFASTRKPLRVFGFLLAGALVSIVVATWTALQASPPAALPQAVRAVPRAFPTPSNVGLSVPATEAAPSPAPPAVQPPAASTATPRLPAARLQKSSKAGAQKPPRRAATAPASSAKRSWLDTGEM